DAAHALVGGGDREAGTGEGGQAVAEPVVVLGAARHAGLALGVGGGARGGGAPGDDGDHAGVTCVADVLAECADGQPRLARAGVADGQRTSEPVVGPLGAGHTADALAEGPGAGQVEDSAGAVGDDVDPPG